jgi:hypothetical protein
MIHLSLLGFWRVSKKIHAFFPGSRILLALLANIVLHVHARKRMELNMDERLVIFYEIERNANNDSRRMN